MIRHVYQEMGELHAEVRALREEIRELRTLRLNQDVGQQGDLSAPSKNTKDTDA
nr:hypothetical protein [uncultured Halomonas sp.]